MKINKKIKIILIFIIFLLIIYLKFFNNNNLNEIILTFLYSETKIYRIFLKKIKYFGYSFINRIYEKEDNLFINKIPLWNNSFIRFKIFLKIFFLEF